ncbi:hypothetical protein AVEN_151277-1 [Araneus ventricosus]|uniref:Uncharacterized protein n=1 Tax=Araneus ventricosus TaxID=182803 RepID=A0A4Y2PK00_ARAVE|nr:hypothetical protein AVEN_151277-1 [Araneus ventricosus]
MVLKISGVPIEPPFSVFTMQSFTPVMIMDVWFCPSYCLEATGYHSPLCFKDLLWSIPYLSSGKPVRYLSPATASFKAKISALDFFRAQSVPRHPISQLTLPAFFHRLYAARPSHILPFCERAKMLLHDSDLNNITIQSSDFFCFSPWDIPQFSYLNPFSGFD